MDELKQRGSIFSSDSTKTAAVETHEASESVEFSENAAEAESRAEAREIAHSLAGRAAGEPAKQSRYSPVTVSSAAARESSSMTQFIDFLRQTKRVWLAVVGGLVGLIVLVTLAQRGFGWMSQSRERRDEQAVESGTPE